MMFTSVRVIRPKDRSLAVQAYAEASLDNGVQLRDMRLTKSRTEPDKYLLWMPSTKSKRGISSDVYNPISNEAREELTNAIVDALQQAIDKNVNELTVENKAVEPRPPRFSNVHIHKFPENTKLKAFASCTMDGAVALNRIAIILDPTTKALQLTMPNHTVVRSPNIVSYYRMTKESYKLLYETVMAAYQLAP